MRKRQLILLFPLHEGSLAFHGGIIWTWIGKLNAVIYSVLLSEQQQRRLYSRSYFLDLHLAVIVRRLKIGVRKIEVENSGEKQNIVEFLRRAIDCTKISKLTVIGLDGIVTSRYQVRLWHLPTRL